MKKFISYLLILAIAAQMLSVVALAVSGTKYTAELSFRGEHTGSVREYTGTDMHWYGTTYEEDWSPGNPHVFYVSLYKKGLFSSTRIGEAIECYRDDYHYLTWSDVGSGKYYFYYTKARDDANVNSDCITMEMTP